MKKKKPEDEITEKLAEDIKDAIDDSIIQSLKQLANVQPMDGSVHPQIKMNNNIKPATLTTNTLVKRSNAVFKKTKKQANFVLTSTPVVHHKKRKLKAKWTVQTPAQLQAFMGIDMIHPYPEAFNITAKRIEKDLKEWSEERKNVFYHYVLVNPFQVPSAIQESYFFIFQRALLTYKFATKQNRFGLTKDDMIREIGQFEKNKIDVKVSHVWIVLKSLHDQNAL
jgi:hypothetical protein